MYAIPYIFPIPRQLTSWDINSQVTSYVVAYLVVLVQFKLSNKEILGTETTQPSATTTGTPFLQGTE